MDTYEYRDLILGSILISIKHELGEASLEKNPDYIFVMDRAVIAGGDISAKQVMDNDLIKSTKAYENENIVYLDAHIWYVSSGGLNSTLKMVEEIEAALDK